MTRPLFLQRTARRNVHQFGIAREPAQPTEADLRMADVALAYMAGACSMGVAMLFILTFLWRPTCF